MLGSIGVGDHDDTSSWARDFPLALPTGGLHGVGGCSRAVLLVDGASEPRVAGGALLGSVGLSADASVPRARWAQARQAIRHEATEGVVIRNYRWPLPEGSRFPS